MVFLIYLKEESQRLF